MSTRSFRSVAMVEILFAFGVLHGCGGGENGTYAPCADVTCSDHGTCVETDGQATCHCEGGYHADGLSCVVDADPCQDVNCSDHGLCVASGGVPSCDCDVGYYAEGVTCIANSVPLFGARPVVATDVSLATKYAAPDGDGDGTFAHPYDLQTALNSLVAGDVLFLRGGTYDVPTNSLRIVGAAGTEQNPIIVESYPGEVAILDGKNRTPSDVLNGTHPTDGGLKISYGARHIKIRKIEVVGMSREGIYVGSKNITIEGCYVHDNFGPGIHVVDDDNGYTTPYVNGWNIIRDNIVHDNSDAGITGVGGHADGDNADGIHVASGQSNIVTHNTVYHNSDDGIDVWKSNDTEVSFNMVSGNGIANGNGNGLKLGGDALDSDGNGRDAHALHNLVYGNRAPGINLGGGWDVIIEYNTTWNNPYALVNFGTARRQTLTNNISYNDGGIESSSNSANPGRSNNSWQIGGVVTVASEDPESPDFLRPTSTEHLAIGAYAGL